MELGIAVGAGATATELARLADEAGLDLVVIGPGPAGIGTGPAGIGTGPAGAETDEDVPGLDPWTQAAWIAGATRRVAVAVPAAAPLTPGDQPDPADPESACPAVIARARDSLDALAPGRTLTDPADWIVAPRNADRATLLELGTKGLPVAVPASSAADVRRIAALRRELTGTRDTGRGIADGNTADGNAAAGGTADGNADDGKAGPGRTARPRRRAAVRARRLPGIDYDGVPESLASTAVEPGDPGYRSVSSTYMRGGAPGLVLRPRTPAQVADAIAFARRHTHVPLGLRSGGHGISGRSTNQGGLVIDVGALNTIEVRDPARRLVRTGPGATWKKIAAALLPYGLAIGSGDYGGVGVGGLATAGGIGFLSREQGLTIDRLRAVELVLADGRQVRASEAENPDLFWAVRGAGANFGVATAFEFEAGPAGNVGWAQLVFVTTDLEQSLRRYGEIQRAAPRDTTLFLVTGPPRGRQSVLQLFGVVNSPDPDTVIERLTPFLEVGTLAQQQVVLTPYAGVMNMAADVGAEGQQGYGEPNGRSAYINQLTPDFARDAARLLGSGAVFFFELRAMGGAITDAPAGSTAFTGRQAAFSVSAIGADDRRLTAAWEPLRTHFDGLYLSFETDRSAERLADAFPGPALTRLRALKRQYDPGNLFRDNFTIEPASEGALA
jgi:hypothetical protein